ncbi:roquin-1-like isoform X2 [Ptychodera flava]|uniref:roquin-1-like isoform X2 n=1 Tax=Ptychodera flava TaxID=63121 RepID=UPI00396A09CE
MPIQAPQWTEFLLCPICYNDFDESARRPISLGCGHTVCRTCLSQLHRKQCPFDQSTISTDIDSLPANYALLQLVGAEIPKAESITNGVISQYMRHYEESKKCVEELALLLKPLSKGNSNAKECILSRPMQRKLVTLVNCQLVEEEGRARASRAARSLGERTVAELILQHQNPQQLSANLWAAVRARGCQFLGPAMQEECLKLVLLALEDGSALSRKVLVLFVVQKLEAQFPQASKTSVGHVVQLLYRASCFKVTKREEDSSLMQLKEEFCSYEALRREHDSQIVQIAMEAGLRISPEQWSSLLYGDAAHKSHMQSIIDKLQTPASFAASVQELSIALQRSGDPANLAKLTSHFELLAEIDPAPDSHTPSWEETEKAMQAARIVLMGLVDFVQHHSHQRKILDQSQNNKYKTSMCRDITQRGGCPRGANCTFAHSQDELEKFRAKSRRAHLKSKPSDKRGEQEGGKSQFGDSDSSHHGSKLVARGSDIPTAEAERGGNTEFSSKVESSHIGMQKEGVTREASPILRRQTLVAGQSAMSEGVSGSSVSDMQAQYMEGYYREADIHEYPQSLPQHHKMQGEVYLPQHESLATALSYDPYYKQPYSPYPRYLPQDIGGVPPMRYMNDGYSRTYMQSGPPRYMDDDYRAGMVPRGQRYNIDDKGHPESLRYRSGDHYYFEPADNSSVSYQPSVVQRQEQSMDSLQERRRQLIAQLGSLPTSSYSQRCELSTQVSNPSFSTVSSTSPSSFGKSYSLLNTSVAATSRKTPTQLSVSKVTLDNTVDEYSGVPVKQSKDRHAERRQEEVEKKSKDTIKDVYDPWTTGSTVAISTPVSPVNNTPPTSSIMTLSKTMVRHMSLEDSHRDLPGFGDGDRATDLPPRQGHDHQGHENAARGRKIRRQMELAASQKVSAADDDFIPFDPPRISKYGPISRMARSIIHDSVPVQAKPTPHTETTPVMSYSDAQMATALQQASPGKQRTYEEKVQPHSRPSNIYSVKGKDGQGTTDNQGQLHSEVLDRMQGPIAVTGSAPQSTAEREQLKIELQHVDQQIMQQRHAIDVRIARDTLMIHREEKAISAHKDPGHLTPSIDDELLARRLQEVELGIQAQTLVSPRDADTLSDRAIASRLQEDEMELERTGGRTHTPPVSEPMLEIWRWWNTYPSGFNWK